MDKKDEMEIKAKLYSALVASREGYRPCELAKITNKVYNILESNIMGD